MAVKWFAQIAGITLEQVPYRGGGQAINDLLGGHVKLGSLGSTPLIPHYKAGTLRLLAQTSKTRSPSLPDVPTYEEAGMKGLVLDQWLGVFAPARTSPDIASRLNSEINKAIADPAVRKNLLDSAQEPIGGTSRSIRRPGSRGLREVRAAGEGSEHQGRVASETMPFSTYLPEQMGGITLSPAGPFIAGAHVELTLVYTAGTFGIDDTGMVKISWRTTSDMSKPQFDKPQAANFTTVEASNGAKLEVWFDRLNVRPFANTLSDSGWTRLFARRRYADDTSGRSQAGLAGLPVADQRRSECGVKNLGRCVCDV